MACKEALSNGERLSARSHHEGGGLRARRIHGGGHRGFKFPGRAKSNPSIPSSGCRKSGHRTPGPHVRLFHQPALRHPGAGNLHHAILPLRPQLTGGALKRLISALCFTLVGAAYGGTPPSSGFARLELNRFRAPPCSGPGPRIKGAHPPRINPGDSGGTPIFARIPVYFFFFFGSFLSFSADSISASRASVSSRCLGGWSNSRAFLSWKTAFCMSPLS